MKRSIRLISVLLAAALALSLAACSGANADNKATSTAAYHSQTATEEAYEYPENGSAFLGSDQLPEAARTAEGGEGAAQAEQKLIYTADARLETKDIEPALNFLYQKISEFGCVIESEQVYNIDAKAVKNEGYYFSSGNPEADFSIRVPAEHYEAFLKGLKSDTDVLYVQRVTSSVQNLTRTYYDLQARISTLRGEEEWLTQYMSEAQNVSEMLEIKDRLTEVQYEIEQLTTHVNTIDYDADYSTVHIELVQVSSYTESRDATFSERLSGYFEGSGATFLSTMEGILEALIYLLPFLALGGVVAFVIVKLVKATNRRKAKKHPPFSTGPQSFQPPQQPPADEGSK